MIRSEDFKIEIRFVKGGEHYYEVFRKGEPYKMQLEDYCEMKELFVDLAVKLGRHIDELKKTEELLSARKMLEGLSKTHAMKMLSEEGKRMWVDVHNATGNCYRYCGNGDIEDVPMEGVWK